MNKLDSVIRVLVIDDSAFMRKIITDILNSDNGIQVVDTAKNGFDALEKFKSLKPDVVTLDVEMPEMNGLACLKELLKISYVPVVMLSSLTRKGAEATIQALTDGAVDFITKPENIFGLSGEDKRQEIINKIKIARSIVRIKKVAYVEKQEKIRQKPKNDIIKSSDLKGIIAIGSSTGGPRALQDVLPRIPGDIAAAVLVVQHMPAGFTKSLADRLNGMSELTVKEAEQGEIVKPGYAYIAPGDYHMRVEDRKDGSLRLKLSQDAAVGGHRPSVNVMMESLSNTSAVGITAIIMTGMGSDGSEGVKKIKANKKCYIIAQDEKTCVVYGMPKVAVETGVVDAIVPLKEISKEILRNVGGKNNGYEPISGDFY